MKDTISVINQMKADGVVGKYAIGGAVGATFYLEPFATIDIGIFVAFKQTPDSLLVSLSPVYDYLTARGYTLEGEYIVVEGWQVQFLPPGNPLEEEALEQAIETEIDGVEIWVMTAEHLVAIALKLGRPKDYSRILMFIESGKLDPGKLDSIFQRHQLVGKWEAFGDRFLREL
ncbi:MAG: hypothetical protein H0X66_06640 [Verrucomicrobia bacterium]|nr:hypothetical protein [Verrucomicrobiota bacterium]